MTSLAGALKASYSKQHHNPTSNVFTTTSQKHRFASGRTENDPHLSTLNSKKGRGNNSFRRKRSKGKQRDNSRLDNQSSQFPTISKTAKVDHSFIIKSRMNYSPESQSQSQSQIQVSANKMFKLCGPFLNIPSLCVTHLF